MNFYIVAAIVFLLSIFGSKVINDRGLKLLNNDQKGLLVKAFGELYKYQLVFLAIIIGLYFLLAKLFPQSGTIIMSGYLGLLLLFMFLHGFLIAKKLASYGIPKSYSRYYVMSTFVKTGGMLFAMAILFLMVKK